MVILTQAAISAIRKSFIAGSGSTVVKAAGLDGGNFKRCSMILVTIEDSLSLGGFLYCGMPVIERVR